MHGKCDFCGKEKKVKADVRGPRVFLIENEKTGQAICNHCLVKSLALFADPQYENETVISIDSPLSPTAA